MLSFQEWFAEYHKNFDGRFEPMPWWMHYDGKAAREAYEDLYAAHERAKQVQLEEQQAPKLRREIVALQAELAQMRGELKSLRSRSDAATKTVLGDDEAPGLIAGLTDRVKALEARPEISYKGVFQDGICYPEGSVITFGGSAWIAKATTYTKPGNGATPWQLMVKHGRDGKDAPR